MLNTELKDGLHLVKVAGVPESARVSIPGVVREAMGLRTGMYVTMRVLGPCIVISQAQDVTPEGAQEDAEAAFKKAIREWEKAQKRGDHE